MRRLAIALGMLALAATLFGVMPGRHVMIDGACRVESSIHAVAMIALLAVGGGAAWVAIVPRRDVMMMWLAASGIIALGYVIARLWLVGAGQVAVSLWPRIVTLSLIALLATTMFGLLIWLVMTDGLDSR